MLKQAFRTFFPRQRAPEPEKPTLEQMKEVIELAEQFDKLQVLPVWERVLRYLGNEVNLALLEQSKCLFDPEQGRIRHLIWNSKRELLDGMQGWIEATQIERDRIIGEFRERSSYAGRDEDRV